MCLAINHFTFSMVMIQETTLSNTIDVGCVGFRALAKYDNSIYFLDYDGLKYYNSGKIYTISDKINYWITNPIYSTQFRPAMFINNDYLYLSLHNSYYSSITIELNLKNRSL